MNKYPVIKESLALDKHAPISVKEVVLRPHAPWYDEHIRQLKVERRRVERIWAKDKTEVNKEILKSKQKQVNKLCIETKRKYYNKRVLAAPTFRCISQLVLPYLVTLHRKIWQIILDNFSQRRSLKFGVA